MGVSYQATPAVAVNVSGEYNYLGKVGDIKVDQTGANIGVRMNF
ncbi:opacity family porin [Moraxella porci]